MGRSSFCFTLFTHKVLKYLQTLGFIVYTVSGVAAMAVVGRSPSRQTSTSRAAIRRLCGFSCFVILLLGIEKDLSALLKGLCLPVIQLFVRVVCSR